MSKILQLIIRSAIMQAIFSILLGTIKPIPIEKSAIVGLIFYLMFLALNATYIYKKDE